MHALRTLLLALSIVLGTTGCSESQAPADDPASRVVESGPITAADLPLRDEYWPRRVYLTVEWRPPESEEDAGKLDRGILLRVESPELARIDFGRRGIHDVPIAVTDLVERANDVREQGPDSKIGNVTRLFGGALIDTRVEPWQAYRRSQLARQDLLLVAAPLDAELLKPMAEPLRQIHETEGVEVVFLAQGGHTNVEIYDLLRGIGWRTPFLRQGFIDTTTDGYLSQEIRIPWLGLVTPNGRPLYEGPWPEDGNLQPVRDALEKRERERPAAVAGAASEDANLQP